MAVKLYNWDDTGAPQLGSTNDGSLINILRACLVDGYGTRTSAGWSMPFSDLPNNKAAFKPVVDDFHIQVDDNYDYRWAKVKGFSSMSALDVGSSEFPIPSRDLPSLTNFFSVSKRYNTAFDSTKWHMIVDDTFFYFFSEEVNYPSGFFYGKMDFVDPLHTPLAYVLSGYITASGQTSTNVLYSLFQLNSGSLFLTNDVFNPLITRQLSVSRDTTSYINPNPITGKLLLQKWKISYSTPVIHVGELPNFFRCNGNVSIFKTGDKIILNGVKYIIIQASISNVNLFEYSQDVG